ncbi:Splicing factor PWI domain-containing protein, putative isoform 2 [Theobroma cacao]|uniref:Splicing factor PWI domain-containing protein, putative isoform 2 n=1 Tax=Theobroma cacao TaxID=3641 RepID=A0A061GXL7_THECC|nr:Splicing factor PWI domain-containing protein, putative isoform 2 [Theobroma cacao]
MSGGFFRGTSADQDTRFSNKQAKLLKSQKFAPELDHLVDMTKVEMDVIRPWIATRVTELLGFEDEVLINFIYGLLDGKEVNGKQVQISLTGFMEKNTGKFMKELWTLLLSAQRNASGVPQQFLDAKEEETRKKKAESDRIANEIQKKKDKESGELEQERLRKMDNGDERKAGDLELEPSSKNKLPKSSSARPEGERDADQRNGVGRKRVSRSPCSTDRSASPRGPRSQSISRSLSNSRSYSDDKQKSRSVSRSPQQRQRSISSDRMYRSPRRRSLTPRSRHSPRSPRSPARRRLSYSRRRSRSRSPRRSRSPIRRRLRSPYRRRSPTPVRRRSRSPIRRHRSPSPIRRHRSPSPIRRHRSPSPIRRHRSPLSNRRHRSPSLVRRRRSPSLVRRRSPSPVRRRSPSPGRRRSPSPIRRRSLFPVRRKSPSPLRRRSPPPMQRKSPSPMRQQHRRSSSTPPRYRSSSLVGHRSPASSHRSITPSHGRSRSPYQSSSLSPVQRRSSSPVMRSPEKRRSPLLSPGERQGVRGKLSPVGRRLSSSPDRDRMDQRDAGYKVPALSLSPNKSSVSKSPSHVRNRSASEDRRSSSPYESPMRQRRERIASHDGSSPERKPRELKGQRDSKGTGRKNEASRSRHSPLVSKQRVSPRKVHTSDQLAGGRSTESLSRLDNMESRKKDLEIKSEKCSGKGVDLGTPDRQRSPAISEDTFQGEKQSSLHLREGKRSSERGRSRQNDIKDSDQRHKAETSPMLLEKLDQYNHGLDSGSEGSDKHRTKHKEKRKHKRSERREVTSDDDSSYDSEIEGRKEAKRRRKEEKRLRKEEKRRRREERRRRREERRAEKLKMKGQDDDSSSDGEHVAKRKSQPSDDEDAETEQKKLEIELRKKAIESLKAKKGISR